MKWSELQDTLRVTTQAAKENGTLDARSVVNPSLTHGQALEILTKAVATRDPNGIVDMHFSRDALMVRNVNRECGEVA